MRHPESVGTAIQRCEPELATTNVGAESAAKEVEQQRVQMMMKQRRTFIGQVLRSLRVAAQPSHRPS